jgi:EAL domain-containing protein (putative c-di-GMP-specific phosphodiesterase class I)/AmiR/NasT family two-component response regulator
MLTSVLTQSRVLIVDDQQDNVLLMTRFLQSAGYENIMGINDPRIALATVHDWVPDLVLLDLHMPHIDGITLLKLLREQELPSEFVPVIVLTADAERDSLKEALSAGANDFLTKPVEMDEFLLRVRNLLIIRLSYEALKQNNAVLAMKLRSRMQSEWLQTESRNDRIAVMKGAIAKGPEMVFQPIVDLKTSRPVGFEALARFDSEVPPDRWFAEAWSLGLGIELELAAINRAFEHFELFQSDEFLAVNASPAAMLDERFFDAVINHGHDRVVVEVTEHQPVASYEDLNVVCKSLRGEGIRIAIDDAGAGYASFHHILMLAPDIIKIDMSLTRDIDHDPVKGALAVSLLQFSQKAHSTVIAEGIETEAELHTLRALDVPWGQGFHIARPDHAANAVRPVYKVG